MKKQIDFWEIQIKFDIRKNSYNAKNINELRKNVFKGLQEESMNNIEQENINVEIK